MFQNLCHKRPKKFVYGLTYCRIRDSNSLIPTVIYKVYSSSSGDFNHDSKIISDETLKLNTQKSNHEALVATGVGAAVNLGLAGSKGVIGYTVGSTALMADCFNSMGDLFSDAVVFFTVIEARKGTSPERPWGRGKFEPLGAFVVGGLLGLTG